MKKLEDVLKKEIEYMAKLQELTKKNDELSNVQKVI